MENKKGNINGVILVVFLLFIILFAGFMLIIASSVLNWTADNVVPDLSNLGMVGDANLTESAQSSIVPLNSFIQSFTWLTGVLYIFGLLGVIGLAVAYRSTPSRWLMVFFFMLVFILIIASIFVSNIYEEFHNGGDEFGTILREHTILDYMILYSPMIMSIISFIAGIILFSGLGEEGGYV